MAKKKTRTVARSAKTGRFVKKSYAKTHKSTTEVEHVKVRNKRSKHTHSTGDKP